MRRPLAYLAVPALVLTMSACGSGSYGSGSPGPAPNPAPAAQQGTQQGTSSAEHSMLSVSESPQLGWYVTDGDGLPLYRYDKDTAKPPKSSCEADCAAKWPPVAAKGQPMTAGVDPTLLGTVTRSDGTKQLTIAGWPMYHHSEDKQAGDTKGHAKGGTWFATAPDGQKAAPMAGGGNGY